MTSCAHLVPALRRREEEEEGRRRGGDVGAGRWCCGGPMGVATLD